MRRTTTWLAAVVLAATALAQDQPLPPYPTLEGFVIQKESAEDYLKAAEAYVRDHADSPYAPRVLMDLYMFGAVQGNANLMEQARRALIYNMPMRLQSRFLLRQFIGQPQALRQFLLPYVNPEGGPASAEAAAKLTAALRSAAQMAGTGFFEDTDFMLACAAVTEVAGDAELHKALVDRLKQTCGDGTAQRAMLDACFLEERSMADKVRALEAQPAFGPARFAQRMYLASMPEDQKRQPAVLRIMATRLLEQSQFAQAQLVAQSILDHGGSADHRAQARFWLGWCQAAQGQIPSAVASFNLLDQEHGGSAWAASGQRLSRQLNRLQQNLQDHGAYLLTMLQDLHDHLDVLEFTVRGTPAGGDPFELYYGAAAGGDLRVDLRVAQRPAVFYDTRGGVSRILLAGERSGYRANQTGPTPVPQISFAANPGTGGVNWSFAVALKPHEQLFASLKQTLESRWMATPEGLTQLLVGAVSRGALPFTPERAAGGIRLKWICPDIQTGRLDERTFLLDDTSRLIEYQSQRMTVRAIRYGKPRDVQLSPPEEPRVSWTDQDQFDTALLTRGYSEALKMIIELLRPAR